MWLDDHRTALYRLYDGDGTLLYIGITADVEQRMRGHRSDKPWWPAVARTELEWHPTRTVALVEELQAIQREKPLHNLAGTPQGHKRRELEDREVTTAEARGLLAVLDRGIFDCEQPIFVVDETKARKPVAVLVSPEFYAQALANLGETVERQNV
ncbi:GIY-YIG catalytic domain protein [Streptomyces sp. ADI96-15]|uniref:GIY-YIG nuclease family protein n=1 Tax=Streptomyces sp. ADI96-15 TaxID=1522761 RepID=UPI000F558540|nr:MULTISPECIES: GIY-YIG nuclease family protein [unclassified Streptomyces]MDH6189199.1 putative GIY-YIG superfamily endonuclease [Streptomyces sp. CZ24]RPK58126.1 GIY-YIG catalytic domain protein [Streptomyces sp. ADI96-15]